MSLDRWGSEGRIVIVTVSMRAKQRWFDQGADALRQFAKLRPLLTTGMPDKGDFYMCPCCMWGFTREALVEKELTAEHVPPRALGGREMLLTCKECNNRAGDQLDAFAASRERFERFMITGVRDKAATEKRKVIIEADGIPLRGRGWFDDQGTLQFQSIDKANDPKVRAEHIAKLDEYSAGGVIDPRLTFNLPVEHWNPARANLSWIRSAYLIAFCAFGIPYVGTSPMAEVRHVIDNPGIGTTPIRMSRDEAAAPDRRVIGVMKRPIEVTVVCIGQFSVLLPSPESMMPLTALAKLVDDHQGDNGMQLSGKIHPWPNEPTYRYL